jgi:Fe-S cluster biogenesis protein NfuA
MSLRDRVAKVLADEVGPALEMDGTQIEVVGIEDGVARLRLGGVCGSCPSSIMAVVTGIEEVLRQHVPEIAYIEAIP